MSGFLNIGFGDMGCAEAVMGCGSVCRINAWALRGECVARSRSAGF